MLGGTHENRERSACWQNFKSRRSSKMLAHESDALVGEPQTILGGDVGFELNTWNPRKHCSTHVPNGTLRISKRHVKRRIYNIPIPNYMVSASGTGGISKNVHMLKTMAGAMEL